MTTSTDMTLQKTTVKQVLPYQFSLSFNGQRVVIRNTRDEVISLTKSQIQTILLNPDLDVHRRKMYEEALAYFDTNTKGA